MSKVDKTANAVSVMALAAVAGAAVALLFAPKKGSETRDDIKRKLREAKYKSQDTATDLKHKAQDMVGDVRKKGEEVSEDVADVVADARSQVEDAANQAKARSRRP